jgi:hypothetical protein
MLDPEEREALREAIGHAATVPPPRDEREAWRRYACAAVSSSMQLQSVSETRGAGGLHYLEWKIPAEMIAQLAARIADHLVAEERRRREGERHESETSTPGK